MLCLHHSNGFSFGKFSPVKFTGNSSLIIIIERIITYHFTGIWKSVGIFILGKFQNHIIWNDVKHSHGKQINRKREQSKNVMIPSSCHFQQVLLFHFIIVRESMTFQTKVNIRNEAIAYTHTHTWCSRAIRSRCHADVRLFWKCM